MVKKLVILSLVSLFGSVAPAWAQDITITPPQRRTQPTPATKPNNSTANKPSTLPSSTSSSSTSQQIQIIIKPTTGTINGHEWVDLGLSVKWATCNVGASTPSDYGNYYAWGETRTKSEYTEENSVTYWKSMGSIAGNSQYDAARANWGSTWRLPTYDEMGELVNKCNWKWTTLNGHNGYKVTGPNGNSIFLPAAGWRHGTSLLNAGEYGDYWSATPFGEGTYGAYNLYFDSGDFGRDWAAGTTGCPCAQSQNKSVSVLDTVTNNDPTEPLNGHKHCVT